LTTTSSLVEPKATLQALPKRVSHPVIIADPIVGAETKQISESHAVESKPTDSLFQQFKVKLTVPEQLLPLGLRLEDHDLVQSTQAEGFPPVQFLKEVFQQFNRHVYWQIPVVDIENLISLLCQSREVTISPLLLHAITITTIPHLSQEILLSAGFNSHSAAGTALRRKVKVCFLRVNADFKARG
jgi:hypothetical protein